MKRAASSIPLTIAEGCGKNIDKDFVRFLDMSLGSAEELEYCFLLAKDLDFICLEDYAHQPTPAEKKQYAPNGEKILMHISNFRKVKRVEDVLKVFNKVRKEIPAKLILIGDGPERSNIENGCRNLEYCNDVIHLGKLRDTEKILSVADLFLLTSETESFGLAALEAMAAKVPVISTNTGGIPEVNIHNFSGMLSAVGDVDDMAKNALAILKDERTQKKFSENAFEQAKKFSIEKILPMYEQLYEKVISGR